MKKISTLFKKDPNNLSRVIDEINPDNQWVLDGNQIPTQKFDGTACAIINGQLYKRYDVKKGKQVPDGAIPCQDPDSITGHWPHWVKCEQNDSGSKWHMMAFHGQLADGTYELCGEKVQGNPEKIVGHELIRHASIVLHDLVYPLSFEGIRIYLESHDIEGIVFHHHNDGRMCKIRKSDFGIVR